MQVTMESEYALKRLKALYNDHPVIGLSIVPTLLVLIFAIVGVSTGIADGSIFLMLLVPFGVIAYYWAKENS